jgi:tetratricopeptide (TPR) repeat protein
VVLALLPVGLALATLLDYSLYRDVIVRSGMQDMTASWILDGAKRRDRQVIEHARNALEESPKAPAATPLAPAGDAATQPPALPPSHLNRSVQHCQRREFAECVNAALAALQDDPLLPEAWNNAAVGYAGMGRWDDAIRSANQALKLRPDFQLAKNNLAWASKEQALRAPVGR